MNIFLLRGLKGLTFIVVLFIVVPSFVAQAQGPTPFAKLAAASAERVSITYHRNTGMADFISGSFTSTGDTAEARARAFLTVHGALLGVRDASAELRVLREDTDTLGMNHIVYEQHYQGVPVFGARVVVHLKPDGRIATVNGQFQPDLRLMQLTPALTGAQAQQLAQSHLRAVKVEWQAAPRLVIWTRNERGTAQLVWEVRGFAHEPLGRWHYFMDARTGEVVYRLNELHTARNRNTHTANNGTTLPGTLICTEGSCVTGDTVIQAAHTYAGAVYDYYKNTFNRDSYDNLGATLISSVHYRTNYNNAFWSGTQMVYGDGDGVTFSPLAQDLDVVAHELTHAVTDRTSDLFYEYESGALNESYSDVFAVFVNQTNWQIGEVSYTPSTPGDALRDMADPTQGGQWNVNDPEGSNGQPDHMSVFALLPSVIDNGGVHINSGIPNKAAYLITNGGVFHSITVTGIGFAKAAQIYYRTQTLYNTPFTNFANAANNTYRACLDLIGQFSITNNDCNSVLNGWAAVGLGRSVNQTRQVFLPLITSGQAATGIYGTVTLNGAPTSGQSLELRLCPTTSGSCSSAGFATTDASGVYRFTPTSLSTGYYYYVRYIQPTPRNCSKWWYWYTSDILQYTAGQTVKGGDFDLVPINLVLPSDSASLSGSSQTFVWATRTLPVGTAADWPELNLYNPSTFTTLYASGALARGTTSKLVTGLTVRSYAWDVTAYSPAGYGVTWCSYFFDIVSARIGFELGRMPARAKPESMRELFDKENPAHRFRLKSSTPSPD
jgi:thermolysin